MAWNLVVTGLLALLLTLIAVTFVVLVVEIVGDRRLLRRLAAEKAIAARGEHGP